MTKIYINNAYVATGKQATRKDYNFLFFFLYILSFSLHSFLFFHPFKHSYKILLALRNLAVPGIRLIQVKIKKNLVELFINLN